MKESLGVVQDISYQADCPYCEETTYSDIHREEWENELEYGDGHPYGVLNCPSCQEDFELSIE